MERMCQVALVSYFVIGGVLFRAVLGEAKSVMPQVVVWRVKGGGGGGGCWVCVRGGKFVSVVLGESGDFQISLHCITMFFLF